MSYFLAIFPPDRDISSIVDCFKQFDVQFEVQSTFEGLQPFAENYVAQQGLKVNIKKEVEAFPDASGFVVVSEAGPVDNREPVYPSFHGPMTLPHRIIVKKEFEDVEEEMNCAPRVKPEFDEISMLIQPSRKRKWSSGVEADSYDLQDTEEAAESFSTPSAHAFRSITNLLEEDVHGADFDDEKGEHGQEDTELLMDNTDFTNVVGVNECPVDGCSVKLDSSENLAGHMKEHSAPWLCGICKRCCLSRSALRIHYRMHTGEKPFKCVFCEKSFARKGQFNLHQRDHTEDWRFNCIDCGFKTNYLTNLKVHQRTHTGERPYLCTICDNDFTYLSTFNVHMRSHTGERPFECDICGLQMTTGRNLKQHKWSHTGEKPFSCQACDFKTAHGSALNKHKKKFSH